MRRRRGDGATIHPLSMLSESCPLVHDMTAYHARHVAPARLRIAIGCSRESRHHICAAWARVMRLMPVPILRLPLRVVHRTHTAA